MLIIGARRRTPATSVTNARSYSPAQCVTSVDVPPMSNPMMRSKPARRATSDRADDAAGRARQDRVLALEATRIGETARRLHELQAWTRARGRESPRRSPGPGRGRGSRACRIAEVALDFVDVAPQDRRQVRVDHRRVAARYELHQRARFARHRYLRKAHRGARSRRSSARVGGSGSRASVRWRSRESRRREHAATAPRSPQCRAGERRRRARRCARRLRSRARRAAPEARSAARRASGDSGSRCEARRRSRA